jgi:hypothetical protein
MPALIFAAFSLISVPAYVAMFSSDEQLDVEDDSEEETLDLFGKHLEKLTAAPPAQISAPTSGLFQVGRLKRLM